MAEIFLGRTEEQKQFRRVLQSFIPGQIQRYFPTFAKAFAKSPPDSQNSPHVLLFHGQGGMGKTTLMNRLRQIAERDEAFKDQFQVLFLDWEVQKNQTFDLGVGHDYIAPETLLKVLHKEIVEVGWGKLFEEYRQRVEAIAKIEAKVKKELKSPACDYTLRRAIRCAGSRVVWAIAGRANLADSGRRGEEYFRGYQADFPEDRLYAKGLSEFSTSDIQAYFRAVVPDRPIAPEQTAELSRFSLGIPFVVREAAAMWREGVPIETIVAPVEVELGKITRHQETINKTSERFLVHCFSAKDRTGDLQAVYALAMMRRPDAALLQAMLDCEDLEERLRSLRERYSFILIEEMRLAEKLAVFIREYLLAEVRRSTPMVQENVERAATWLELMREERRPSFLDTAEGFEDDRLAEWTIGLAYYKFWQSEDAGWRYLLPRFVEGWQYNRRWTRNLLEAVELFQPYWSREGRQRFNLLSQGLPSVADPEDSQRLLAELEKLVQRQWLGGSVTDEQRTILRFKTGQLLYERKHYEEALQAYLEVKNQLTAITIRLKTDLAEALYSLSSKFIWAKSNDNAVYSSAGEQAIEAAIALNAEPTAGYYHNLGTVKALAGQYEKAIAAYEQAITLDPNDAYPHNGLGNVYHSQGQYEKAIAAYEQAITLDPNEAGYHNNLGEVYLRQNELDKAETAFRAAIQKGGETYYCTFNLGLTKALQGQQGEAISLWQKSLTLCDGQTIQEQLELLLIQVALEDEALTPSAIETTIQQARSSKGLLRNTLDFAMLLERCPVQPARVEVLIRALRAALD